MFASGGYPEAYQTGFPITGLPEQASESVVVFHAGTTHADGIVVTNGGRVLGVTGIDSTLVGARDHAHQALASIQFEGRYFRSDIAHRVLTVPS